jgi:hypothetical protein
MPVFRSPRAIPLADKLQGEVLLPGKQHDDRWANELSCLTQPLMKERLKAWQEHLNPALEEYGGGSKTARHGC